MNRRPFFVGVAFVLAATSTAVGARLLLNDPEHAQPDHVERPTAGASAPLPLAAVGGEPDRAAIEITTWIEGVQRAEWYEGVAAAEEAARMEAARAAASQRVAPPRAGAPAAVAGDSGCAYADAIRAAWAGTGDEEWAVNVAMRESRCQPGARNPSGASGLFQLMVPLHNQLIADVCGDPGLVFDPGCNIAAARALYAGAGRGPWGG